MDLVMLDYHEGENNREYAGRVLHYNIMTLHLKPGQPLNEAELAGIFKMSRTPIHEAISMLRRDWLIDIYPQRGTRVSQIDPALVKEGFSVRKLLEAEVLRDTAGKLGRSQIQQLIKSVNTMAALADQLPDRVEDYINLDDDFHRMIYYFGGRKHTWLAIRGLMSHYDRLRYMDCIEGNIDFDRVVRDHREICDYLWMGFPDDVQPEQVVAHHMASFRGDFLERVQKHPDYFALDEVI